MEKKIHLVTGAAGFLGGTVCRHLIARGDKVRAFVLPGDKAIAYVPEEAETVEGNVCDWSSLERFFDVPADTEIVVLHIASIVTVDPDYNPKVMAVNVQGTKNIIEQCRKHSNFKKLVYCGSTGAIPELPKGRAISEVHAYDPDQVVGCYSKSKAMASQAVMDAAREGLDACIVHPTGIMGPDDLACCGETTRTCIKILNGEMPMGISGTFNLADVRDLADGLIAAADHGKRGESYILGNEAVSFRDFARILSEEEKECRRMRMFLPAKVAYFIAGILEKRAKKTGRKPLMTRFSVYNLDRNNVFDSTKAKEELGYRTRSYRDTMSDEISWLKSIGKIA